MDEALTIKAAREALANNIDPLKAINEGLLEGMRAAGRLYEEGEYFVPELLLCSDAMYAGLNILSSRITPQNTPNQVAAVIGVVEGDIHDIGKNLVKLMLEAAGFKIYDLGRDVPPGDFVAGVKETGARILCMSTLMSTTMDRMADVINLLREEGLRGNVAVLVGGGAVSRAFADSIGADGYADDAIEAVRVVKGLVR
ncbi:Methionine synthase [Neomoorella glycerini]|uniref:Methionine synthase n=2 Tax=Neomoorella glycerini TaxID=55779 RepID=A0A6I5ZUB3_9FIRM|nr:Methionine synthase [Moorella glycerini]